MVWSGFRKSVQPKNYFSVKKSSRKTDFSKKKVAILFKIALFQIKCIFTTVVCEKQAKAGKSNIKVSALFGPKKSKKTNSHSPVLPRFFNKFLKPQMTNFSIYACCYTVHCTVCLHTESSIYSENLYNKLYIQAILKCRELEFFKYNTLSQISKYGSEIVLSHSQCQMIPFIVLQMA